MPTNTTTSRPDGRRRMSRTAGRRSDSWRVESSLKSHPNSTRNRGTGSPCGFRARSAPEIHTQRRTRARTPLLATEMRWNVTSGVRRTRLHHVNTVVDPGYEVDYRRPHAPNPPPDPEPPHNTAIFRKRTARTSPRLPSHPAGSAHVFRSPPSHCVGGALRSFAASQAIPSAAPYALSQPPSHPVGRRPT